MSNLRINAFDGSKSIGKVRSESLSHCTVRWIEGGEMSRVVLRDGKKLIGHVSMCPVTGRYRSHDLKGVIRSHKAPFNAIKALEGFAKVNYSDLNTRKVDAPHVREARARFNAEQKEKKAAEKKAKESAAAAAK